MVQVARLAAICSTAASPLNTSSSETLEPIISVIRMPCMKPLVWVTGEAMKQTSLLSSCRVADRTRSP